MELREKIAREISIWDGSTTIWDDHWEKADAILAIPEIRDALRAKAHRDTKVGYERQG